MADAQNNVGVASVNDASTDLDFSGYDGVTQSETHTAMCGNQVVVGFNDSGSLLQTFFFGTGGLSLTGAAVSSDGGKTFHDIGAMNPGADFNNVLASDPILICTDSSRFFYVATVRNGDRHAISVSPIQLMAATPGAIPRPQCSKISPTSWTSPGLRLTLPTRSESTLPIRILMAAAHSPGCGDQTRTAIELVASNDGGQHFSSPVIIDEQCGDNVGVQTSHVAFNSHGVAYIAWHRFNPTNVEVRVTHLSPGGSSRAFSSRRSEGVWWRPPRCPARRASLRSPTEVEEDLQGQFRNFSGLDLAVDHSGGRNDGTVYVTWDDARNKSVPDLVGFTLEGNGPQPLILLPFTSTHSYRWKLCLHRCAAKQFQGRSAL